MTSSGQRHYFNVIIQIIIISPSIFIASIILFDTPLKDFKVQRTVDVREAPFVLIYVEGTWECGYDSQLLVVV